MSINNRKFELGYGLNLNIKASQVNTTTCTSDYLFGSEEDLNTNIVISKVWLIKQYQWNFDLC